MKDIPNQSPSSYLASRLKEIDHMEENPVDRDLRIMRGLSAEVGMACSIWLANRGIRVRTWGNSSVSSPMLKRTRLAFHPDVDLAPTIEDLR
jgi:hypothetical protein